MRKKTLLLSALCTALLTSAAFADSNGVLGVVVNSETQVLSGSLNHGGDPGSADNSTMSATFSGTFDVSQVLIEGDIVGVVPYEVGPDELVYFFGEAAVVITSPSGESNDEWESLVDNAQAIGPFPFSATTPFLAGAAAGTWEFEFFDRADDGPGADTISSNVSVTLQEVGPNVDSNGTFGLTFAADGVANSVGEMLVGAPRIWDEYPINVTEAGEVEITTFEDEDGLDGRTLDSVLAVFDSNGFLIAQNDDREEDFFSRIIINLEVGTYTIVVTGVGGNIDPDEIGFLNLADLVGLGPDTSGDYSLSVSGAPGAIEGVSSVLKGDVNIDGLVNFLDISPFIGVLSNNEFQAEADIDCNGVVNFLDISPFIGILSGS